MWALRAGIAAVEFSMTKKVDVRALRPGMYVSELGADWLAHPFLRSSFRIKDEATIAKIIDAGIHEVYIDPAKGLDVADAPTRQEVQQELEQAMHSVASQAAVSRHTTTGEEMARAVRIRSEAHHLIHDMMNDARLGKQVKLEKVEPVVEKMADSILRNSGALLSLCRVKNKDDYTFQHSISVCALLVAFCRAVGMDEDTIRLAGVGGLLHDIGKVKVPDSLLNKPGRFTDAEFDIMKSHVVESKRILDETPGIQLVSIQVAYEHHERHNGSGYAQGLAGDAISPMGRMAAICDVYDAITSDRVYHRGLAPHEALRKIFEWSKFHFDPMLVQQFMRAIGIYPVGTLVMLESGRIAIVMEQSTGNLLQPQVKIIYDSKERRYLEPQDLDLAQPLGHGGGERIVGYEIPEKWDIDPSRFM